MQKLSIRDLMRTAHVRRWHMCRVLRDQNNAEHMYRVTILARAAYRAITDDSNDFSERELHEITDWALDHDTPEVVNGDVPTPVKERIKATGSKVLEELDAEASMEYVGHKSAVKGSLTETVVKLADLMEAMVFLKDEGVGTHTESVRRGVVKRYNARLEVARKAHPKHQWDAVDKMLHDLMYGQEYSL